MRYPQLHDKRMRSDVIKHLRELAAIFEGLDRGETYKLMVSQLERNMPVHMLTDEMRALLDAELYGRGYLVDGLYVDPRKVKIFNQQTDMIYHDYQWEDNVG